jgi:transcriptional regulator with XRE-family HTH domain
VDLAGRIRAERRARRISQQALAYSAGMSLRALSSLERGEAMDPHYSTLTGLANALGLSVGELLQETPGGTPPSRTRTHAGAPSRKGEEAHRVTPAGSEAFERMLSEYEQVRYRIPLFDDLSLGEKNEVFGKVWALRDRVKESEPVLPKPQAALLHDTLTNAALLCLKVFEQVREQVQDGWAEPDAEITNIADYREYRDRLKQEAREMANARGVVG